MKILLINKYFYHFGGADRYFFECKEVLENLGHTVIPFTGFFHKNNKSKYEKYFVRSVSNNEEIKNLNILQKIKMLIYGVYNREAATKLQQLLDDHEVDCAHVHNVSYGLSYSIFTTLFKNNIPVVQTLHDYKNFCSSGYLFRHNTNCYHCVKSSRWASVLYRCNTESVIKSLFSYFEYLYRVWAKVNIKVKYFTVAHENMLKIMFDSGIDSNKLVIISNPYKIKADFKRSVESRDVSYFGLIARQKGVFTLVKTAELCPQYNFTLFGKGPDLKELKNYIHKKNITNVKIDTLSRFNNGLPEKLIASKVVVNPSQWDQPCEYTTIEARALGCVVLVSNVAGNLKGLSYHHEAAVYRVGDEKALLNKICNLMNNPELRKKLRKINCSLPISNYGSFGKDLLQLYKKARI